MQAFILFVPIVALAAPALVALVRNHIEYEKTHIATA